MFYYITETFHRRYLRGDYIYDDDSVEKTCPKCGTYPDPPPWESDVYDVIELYKGNHLSDILWGTKIICINKRAKEIFENENITGFQLHKVTIAKDERPIADRKKLDISEIKNYYRIIIQGPSTGTNFKKTGFYMNYPGCKICGREEIKRINKDKNNYIDASRWNGNDLFYAEYCGEMTFCTERVVQIFMKYKIKYAEFEEIKHVGRIPKIT